MHSSEPWPCPMEGEVRVELIFKRFKKKNPNIHQNSAQKISQDFDSRTC